MLLVTIGLAWLGCSLLTAFLWSAFHMGMDRLPSPPRVKQDAMQEYLSALASESRVDRGTATGDGTVQAA